ncbi:MAG TPA: hypothetical protein VJA21_07390 [Verrucomicrobiae bacterium]
MPTEPVTLSPEELAELSRKLSDMRHDINNHLSLIVAAMELIRYKPATAERMVATLGEQPGRISESLKKFSTEFEKAFGITKP